MHDFINLDIRQSAYSPCIVTVSRRAPFFCLQFDFLVTCDSKNCSLDMKHRRGCAGGEGKLVDNNEMIAM